MGTNGIYLIAITDLNVIYDKYIYVSDGNFSTPFGNE